MLLLPAARPPACAWQSEHPGVFTAADGFIDNDIQELYQPNAANLAAGRPKAMNADMFLDAFIAHVMPHLGPLGGPNCFVVVRQSRLIFQIL
eukprot:SAG22_NODE_1807_length_3531_cov_1.988636_3_plen_92_part_00